MRRRSKVSTAAAAGKTDNEQNFWPSYADMMSSFALILFFLMLLAYLSNIKTGNSLRSTEESLSATLSQLNIVAAEKDQVEAEKDAKELELSNTKNELQDKQNQLTDAEAAYATVKIRLDAANAELANNQFVLTQLQSTIDTQAQYVADAQVELEKMHGQMETIVGVRKEILDQIKASIDAVSGDSSRASIGENGNIILNDAVFFDTNSSNLKGNSLSVLDQLVTVFTRFLAEPENAKYIDSIIISGHTDSTGTDDINRDLSTARANSVLKYMLDFTTLSQYSDYFCAAGYGSSRPIATNDTAEGRAQNRRIEISLTLKDDTVMDIVNEYLEMDVPDTSEVAVYIDSQN